MGYIVAMKEDMFLGASKVIFQRAEVLRNNQTPTEVVLWNYLRKKPLGHKFRRQHPISTYVADFYCHSLKLIIEIDGDIHLDKEVAIYDSERQKTLEAGGVTFLRFTTFQISNELHTVIDTIENFINAHEKSPL